MSIIFTGTTVETGTRGAAERGDKMTNEKEDAVQRHSRLSTPGLGRE